MFGALVPLAFIAPGSSNLGWLLLLAALMFGVGLIDDIRPVAPTTKLAAQMAVAALFVAMGPAVSMSGVVWLDRAMAFVWIVGITNAFNLLDNIDGLAAGMAVIAGVFALAGPIGATADLAVVTGVMVGAAAGFLVYNWQPASVFMGDSGSHLLGSFLAGATLLAAPTAETVIEPVSAVGILLLVPMADTAVVAITRCLAGRSPFAGGRDHLSHRLVMLGLTERGAVLTLYALALAGGVVALVMPRLSSVWSGSLAALYVASVAATAIYLGRIRPAHAQAPAAETLGTSPRVRPAESIAAPSRARAVRPNPVL